MLKLFFAAFITCIRTFINKAVVNDINSLSFLFIYSCMLLVVTLSLCVHNKSLLSHDIKILTFRHYAVISFSVFSSLYLTNIYFKAMKNNTTIQTIYIIKAFKIIMLAFISSYFFGEKLTTKKIIGLMCIFAGIMMIH